MTELQKQVQRAQRRINFQSFLTALVWSLAICLGIAAIAIGASKIWHINVDPQQWQMGWLIGGFVAGLLGAAGWSYYKRNSMVEAAIEIDRRFGLKERVSSSLALSPEEAESEVGRALISDAAKRVERVDVREQFGFNANRWALLPFATAALAIALVFLPSATPNASNQAEAKTISAKKQVKKINAGLEEASQQEVGRPRKEELERGQQARQETGKERRRVVEKGQRQEEDDGRDEQLGQDVEGQAAEHARCFRPEEETEPVEANEAGRWSCGQVREGHAKR